MDFFITTITVSILKGFFLLFAFSTLEMTNLTPNYRTSCVCSANCKPLYHPDKIRDSGLEWPILRRWEVPWGWQTVSLTFFACGLGFVLTGLVEATALPYLGIQPEVLSLDEKAELLFLDQGMATAAVLGIIYSVFNSYQPLPEDFFKYDLREPFSLQKGWLLWAGVGLVGALLAIGLTGKLCDAIMVTRRGLVVHYHEDIGVVTTYFGHCLWVVIGVILVSVKAFLSPKSYILGHPGGEILGWTDALVRLLPLIGSSSVSTACLVGITGVFAPLLEETVFRGFFMTSLTKWY
ncbi:CAAX amino terminal protease family protein [Trifolium pratense]|uniref:CAAX amino terminal protease family protein n=1 Tax=Trifolium pratense TaxID=57577 RepID=A0A2K3P5N2_TRIPR|nr:CAAX amino terminal protease family protein [Trifolium pratense]